MELIFIDYDKQEKTEPIIIKNLDEFLDKITIYYGCPAYRIGKTEIHFTAFFNTGSVREHFCLYDLTEDERKKIIDFLIQ